MGDFWIEVLREGVVRKIVQSTSGHVFFFVWARFEELPP